MRFLIILLLALTAGKAVAQQVDLGNIPPYVVCENNTDGFATFTLSSYNAVVLNGLPEENYAVEYYYDGATLQNGQQLPDIFLNEVPYLHTIIVVAWELNNPSNISSGYLMLVVDEQPEAYPTAISVCDSDGVPDGYYTIDLTPIIPEVLGGQTTMTVSFYEDETDATNGTNAIAGVQNFGTVTQTIYARVTAPVGACYSTSEIEIFVNTPVALQPGDVSGYAETIVVNIDNPEEYNYQLDNNPPQEDFLFENVTPGLHSVTVTSNTGCGSQVVNNILAVSAAENLIICVPMGNSVGEFNLTENAENVLQGLNPADYSIAYYNGTPDSGNPNGLITNPENYTCIFPGQVIHARVSSISNPDIYADAAFVLIVGPVPPYVVTDDLLVSDDNFDGYTMFDLTVTIPQILDGQPPEVNTITFYTTPSDADAGINPITNPEAYISDTATVYYRTERLEGCYTVGYLNLVVTPFMGTDDIFFTGFSSYPNPVHDALYIKNNNVINSVTILNLLGQQVSHQNISSENAMINMQSLSNGIYLIKVTSGDGEKTIKVVKE